MAPWLIKEHAIAIEQGSRDWWKIVRLMQAASLEHVRRERARVNDTAVEHHFDPFFQGITVDAPAPRPPLSVRVA
jgi:hypothetical protein